MQAVSVMSPTFEAFWRSWPADPWLAASCLLGAAIYLRGWRALRRRSPQRFAAGQLATFCGGVAALWLALASPIEPFASLLLSVHMVQHLLLMMVAPPLIWLGAPLSPMLRGLPQAFRGFWIAPFFRSSLIRGGFEKLTRPGPALAIYAATSLLWHVPAAYELALRSRNWHYVQHVCFFAAALIFWYPVVRPYPSRPRWSRWLLLPYLILADVQNTVLSALLTFSSKVLYPYYEQMPRIGGLSALEDQSIAGLIMWVPGSIAFLVPLGWIGLRLLYGEESGAGSRGQGTGSRGQAALLPILTSPAHASLSPASRFVSPGSFRRIVQFSLLLLAVIVIYDGLAGPVAGPLNLAGVLPWIHWRGLVVLALLAVGNLFCMACPFTLPRRLASRWLPQRRRWPRALRSKWLAVLLLVLFLWSYEAFSLWDSPRWTAWITLGYFLAAFSVDGLFEGAAFCKYVCPIGQFNFVQSLVSPLEIRVREPAICTTCRTKDCIRGRGDLPGCELNLFQPRKSGNMDCTFCLDCVQACPQHNVTWLAALPASRLWDDRFRSGLGRFSRRPDIAALVLVLVFGAFANAAGMVGPVVEWQARLQQSLGLASPLPVTTLSYLLALVILPLAAVFLSAELSKRWGELSLSRLRVATRYAFALVPLGFGMWLAHYSFHFLASYASIVPTTQRFVADLGFSALGEPQWSCSCCAPIAGWLLRMELLFLDFGLLFSLYSGYRMAQIDSERPLRAVMPWAVLMIFLFAVGVWLVFQPMQMRGMIGGG